MRKVCLLIISFTFVLFLLAFPAKSESIRTYGSYTIHEGSFSGCEIDILKLNGFGFSFPVFKSYHRTIYDESGIEEYSCDSFSKYKYEQLVYAIPHQYILEDEDNLYEDNIYKEPNTLEEEIIQIDNHPAYIFTRKYTQPRDGLLMNIAGIYYSCGNQELDLTFYSEKVKKSDWNKIHVITLDDLKALLPYISFDPSPDFFTSESGAFSIKTQENTTELPAGKKLQFFTEYINPTCIEQIKTEKGYGMGFRDKQEDNFQWSVINIETGEACKDITINEKGILHAGGNISDIMHVEIQAKSKRFLSRASYPLTIIPAVKKLSTEPNKIILYEGTNESADIQAILEPSLVPLHGITWTAANSKIISIETNDHDGSVTVSPLKAGNTTITVKEPGGKSSKVNVRVVVPVTDLELKSTGNPVPGGTVNIKAVLTPGNAGIKDVEWTIDVEKDIATISKGIVRISKTAAPGTVITVSCKAVGAPIPVIKTMQIEIQP